MERQQVFNNRNRSTMPSRVCWTDGINLSGLRKYRRDTCWQSRPRTWPPPVRTTRDNDRGPVQERKDGGKQPTAPRWSGTIEKDRVKQPYRIKDPGQVELGAGIEMNTVPKVNEETAEGITYYKNPKLGDDLELPIRESPVRFSIMRENGLSSNAWRVWVQKDGNAYIRSRDHLEDLKISLHKSGKQHIAFTSESKHQTTEGNRFWDQWWEPTHYRGPEVVPTFNLFFPSWALTLSQAMRHSNPKVWDKDQIAIEATETPMATVISFVITNDDVNMEFNPTGESRHFPLAILPLRPGKTLWVVIWHRHEDNMQDLAKQGMSGLAESYTTTPEHFLPFPDGEVLGMCVSGTMQDGGTFLMPYSVELQRSGQAAGKTDGGST